MSRKFSLLSMAAFVCLIFIGSIQGIPLNERGQVTPMNPKY